MFWAGGQLGHVDTTVIGTGQVLAPARILRLVFAQGIGWRLGFLRTHSIFQANPSSRVPSCQGVSAESGCGHAGRVNFDCRSPEASACKSVSADANNVARAGRPGKPRPAFVRGI